MIKKNYVARLFEGICDDAKSRIIRAAIDEFAIFPFAAVRTRQIAAKAGVNHAAISYYFGGKSELYMETIRQLSEYVHAYIAVYFARGAEIEKSKSIDEAKRLIFDFIMSRVCIDAKTDSVMRSIILITTREEMYPTEAFDLIYEKIIYPSIVLLEKLLAIATRGRYAGERARIIAQMLLGQTMMFNSARVGFKRANSWTTFGSAEYRKVEEVFSRVLERILS